MKSFILLTAFLLLIVSAESARPLPDSNCIGGQNKSYQKSATAPATKKAKKKYSLILNPTFFLSKYSNTK